MDHFSEHFVPIGIQKELVRGQHCKPNDFESLGWEFTDKNSIAKSNRHLGRDLQLQVQNACRDFVCHTRGKCVFVVPRLGSLAGVEAGAATLGWPRLLRGIRTPRRIRNSKAKPQRRRRIKSGLDGMAGSHATILTCGFSAMRGITIARRRSDPERQMNKSRLALKRSAPFVIVVYYSLHSQNRYKKSVVFSLDLAH